jgi:L-alanine-DL-glutamate epimerase-like enolase superfamily enzyme
VPESGNVRVSAIRSATYRVPTDQPEADGTLKWDETTLVVVHVTAGDITGMGWTYASGASDVIVQEMLTPVVMGADLFDVASVHESMVRSCRNLGRSGVVSCAISAVDIALWDAKARVLGIPLADLFGRCRDAAPVYGSGGFTTYDEPTAARQLEHWTGVLGLRRVKIKLGQSWGSEEQHDLARTIRARELIGPEAELYVDANGGYSAKQAIRIGQHLVEAARVCWFEEPVSSDSLDGLRLVKDQLPLDVTAGEYGFDERYFERMLAARAVDCLQIDVTRCGGYTSWLRAAALAQGHGLDVSAHCAPNLHAHVATSVPNLRHIEYFWDHERIESMLFDGVLTPERGALSPRRDLPGHGLTLRTDAAEPFRR